MKSFPRLLALAATAFAGVCAAQQVTPGTLNPLSRLDPLAFKAFIEKPLFSPSRSMPAEAVTEAVATEDLPAGLNIRLLGVIVTPDGSVARISDANDGKNHSLKTGQWYQDWKVISVDHASLKLSKDGETKTLSVFTSSQSNFDASLPTEPDEENTVDPNLSTASETSHSARIIKTLPDKEEEAPADTKATKSHQQALIDFFGPGGKPAD